MNIRLKLLLAMAFIAILPALFIAGFSSYKIFNYLETRQGLAMEEESNVAAEYLTTFIRLRNKDLRLLQANPLFSRSLITDFDYSDVDSLLKQLISDQDDSFSFYMLTKTDGTCVGASLPALIGKKNGKKKWHQKTLQRGKFVSNWNRRPDTALLSNPPFGGDDRYTMVFSSAVRDAQGKAKASLSLWKMVQLSPMNKEVGYMRKILKIF